MIMRLVVLFSVGLFAVLYVLGAALMAWAWWLSGGSSKQQLGEQTSASEASEGTRTRAA
jgi:hypothetical protein